MSLYIKLIIDSIRKNAKVYFPFILTASVMIAIYYVLASLVDSETVLSLTGSDVLIPILRMGYFIVSVFSCFFLIYSYSFLIRRRNKELGLYNVLGMSKANLIKLLFVEILILFLISFILGISTGIVLSKLAELGLINIINEKVDYNLFFSSDGILTAILIFLIIFTLLFLNSARQVLFSNSISLLKSDSTGEKAPKGNWLLALLGIAFLGVAYFIAIKYADPVEALSEFFIAVILVIIGTYLVLIAGSVYLCQLLSKNKRFYYKSNHFISVSSMRYRMKRNGASLASICILATMVLVIISSTACLYIATEDLIINRNPRQINLDFRFNRIEDLSDKNLSNLNTTISSEVEKYPASIENSISFKTVNFLSTIDNGHIDTDSEEFKNLESSTNAYNIFLVSLQDYNRITDSDEDILKNQVLVYSNRNNFEYSKLKLNEDEVLIKKKLQSFPGIRIAAIDILPSLIIVVKDLETTVKLLGLENIENSSLVKPLYINNFDTNLNSESQITLYEKLKETLNTDAFKNEFGISFCQLESQVLERQSYFTLTGGIFYIGIILSIIFAVAAVLIIYYKQISEGYEDKNNYEIMKKVGLTKREIKKSINSQLLIVFFLPLVLSIIHLGFSFPMIQQLLLLFNLNNTTLFLMTTAISVLIFAFLYIVIYKLTSNIYYNIVDS